MLEKVHTILKSVPTSPSTTMKFSSGSDGGATEPVYFFLFFFSSFLPLSPFFPFPFPPILAQVHLCTFIHSIMFKGEKDMRKP